MKASIRSLSVESKFSAAALEKRIHGLNRQQGEAVGSPDDGAVLVLAGAGSGKTTVLTRRLAYLLDRFPDTGMLALTFTTDAAHEMSTRLRHLLGPQEEAVSFPTIGTFHSFAFGLIRSGLAGKSNWSRLGFSRCPAVVEASKKKPESDQVTFDDMVPLAIRMLKENPDVLADTRHRFPRILVDEFQDTDLGQLELIQLLAGNNPSLFLVGDDDQSIYGFRGAAPGNIGAAQKYFPGLRILKLEINYRSSAAIVAYANGVFKNKPMHLRKELKAGRSLGEIPVQVAAHANGIAQAQWMIAEMERLRREEGLAWKDMAILFRVNALEPYYRSMLESLAGPEAAAETVLSTVHAAKGLEYPAVFFVGLEAGILPFYRKNEVLSPERVAEEQRIFYVGVTRAQRYLYLCTCRSRVLKGKVVEAKASPFLKSPMTKRSVNVSFKTTVIQIRKRVLEIVHRQQRKQGVS